MLLNGFLNDTDYSGQHLGIVLCTAHYKSCIVSYCFICFFTMYTLSCDGLVFCQVSYICYISWMCSLWVSLNAFFVLRKGYQTKAFLFDYWRMILFLLILQVKKRLQNSWNLRLHSQSEIGKQFATKSWMRRLNGKRQLNQYLDVESVEYEVPP